MSFRLNLPPRAAACAASSPKPSRASPVSPRSIRSRTPKNRGAVENLRPGAEPLLDPGTALNWTRRDLSGVLLAWLSRAIAVAISRPFPNWRPAHGSGT